MNDKDFFNRLQEEIPRWITNGWVSPQYQSQILASVNPDTSVHPADKTRLDKTSLNTNLDKARIKPSFFVFSFLGMSLLTVGIILFFSSNWPMIPKIAKLALLLGGLWASYGIAGYLLTQKKDSPPLRWFSQLLILLGVVIFGTNIFLIAQIYHIDAHFPNGLLLWSLGAWLVALLLHHQPSIVLSLILALIWSESESQYFLRSIHWWFAPIFLLNILPILKEKWDFALHIAFITLILWLTNNILWLNYPFYGSDQPNYFSFYFGLCSLGALTVWALSLAWQDKQKVFAFATLQYYAIFFCLLNLFYLTFPTVLKATIFIPTFYASVTVSFALLLCLAYAWFYVRMKRMTIVSAHLLVIGGLLVTALVILLILNHFFLHYSLLAVGFNFLFIGFVLWFIALGYELREVIYINLAFLFFALFVVARYFDVFWDLLNRSFFFMGGGLILLLGSYILEKKRRTLTRDLKY